MPGSSWFQPGLDLNVLISLFLIVILPFLLGQMFSVSPGLIAALIAATLIIEYSAPAAGLAAGLPSVYTGITVILVACGVIYVQYSIFDTLSCRSERVKGFLEWIRRKYGGSRVIQHYGVLALVPGMLTVGFYICPAVSWMFGWDRRISFVVMISVYGLATVGVLIAGIGIIHWFFS